MRDFFSIFQPDANGKFPDDAELCKRAREAVREAEADMEAEFGLPGSTEMGEPL